MNIYKSTGLYIGFILQDNFFSWDGKFLGWLDNQSFIWDRDGNFRGQLVEKNGIHYILRNSFQIPPLSKPARSVSPSPIPPTPSAPVPSIILPIGVEDAF